MIFIWFANVMELCFEFMLSCWQKERSSWYFGYGNNTTVRVRASADPYFDFISFTKIKKAAKKKRTKQNKKSKIKRKKIKQQQQQQHEKQLRQQQQAVRMLKKDTRVQAKK